MVKKRSAKKAVKEECCSMEKYHCGCRMFSSKLASMAFLLFLITVWTGLGRALLEVHWGIYLGITILLVIFHGAKGCCKKK